MRVPFDFHIRAQPGLDAFLHDLFFLVNQVMLGVLFAARQFVAHKPDELGGDSFWEEPLGENDWIFDKSGQHCIGGDQERLITVHLVPDCLQPLQ